MKEGLSHNHRRRTGVQKNQRNTICKAEGIEKGWQRKKAAHALTDDEVDILYGKNLLGLSSPESLLNTLWLNNTQHFGLRGCQEHRDMKWGDIQLKTTANIPSDKQKQEPAQNPKFAQLNQKCFLSQAVTEILYKPITCMKLALKLL